MSIAFSSRRGEPDAGLLMISAHKLSATTYALLNLTVCSSSLQRRAARKLFSPIVESIPICSNIVKLINELSGEYDDTIYFS